MKSTNYIRQPKKNYDTVIFHNKTKDEYLNKAATTAGCLFAATATRRFLKFKCTINDITPWKILFDGTSVIDSEFSSTLTIEKVSPMAKGIFNR